MKNKFSLSRQVVVKDKRKFVIIAVCIIAVFLACWIGNTMYSASQAEQEKQEKLGADEQAQLLQMTDYLQEIDKIITSNAEHLSQASVNSVETEKNLSDIMQKLLAINTRLSSVSTKVNELMQVQDTRLSDTLNTINSTLSKYQSKIETQLKTVSEILTEIKSENSEQHGETISKLLELEKSLTTIESDMESYHSESMSAIKKLKAEMNKSDADLLNAVNDIEDSIKTLTKKEFGELKLQLDKSVLNLLQKLQALHQQVLDAETSVTGLIRLADGNAEKRQDEIRIAFDDVNKHVEQITSDFNKAHQEIQQLIVKLQESENVNHKETLDVLNKMESDMNDSSLQSLNKITESLKNMQDSMKDELSQNFNDLTGNVTNSFDALGGNMTQQHEQVVAVIESTTTALQKEIISTLANDNVALKEYLLTLFSDSDEVLKEYINNALGTQNSDLQLYLKTSFDKVNQQLEQLFTSVSSGKQGLASALTDKLVDTDATAKFSVMATNILKIGENADVTSSAMLNGFTAFTGSGYVTGNMPNHAAVNASLDCSQSYTIPLGYHNGNGVITANTLASQTPATATVANLSKGATGWVAGRLITGTGADNDAAYNQGYADGSKDALNGANITYTYHTHSGSAAGTGCYTVPVYHVHTSACNTSVRCSCPSYIQGDFLGNHAIDGWPMWRCNNCGDGNWEHSDGKCNVSKNQSGCGKTDSTVESYDLGCGKTEATIESATIVFS